jgi:hypothetical protein
MSFTWDSDEAAKQYGIPEHEMDESFVDNNIAESLRMTEGVSDVDFAFADDIWAVFASDERHAPIWPGAGPFFNHDQADAAARGLLDHVSKFPGHVKTVDIIQLATLKKED